MPKTYTRKQWSSEMVEVLTSTYPEQGPNPVMERFGLTYHSVTNKAKKLKLRYNNRTKASGLAQTGVSKKYTLNHDYFKTLSSECSYIVGYIYADGCVTDAQLKLGCTSEDEQVLFDIRNALGSNAKHTRRLPPVMAGGYQPKLKTEIDICSRTLVKDLVNLHGLCRDKSHNNLPFPENHICNLREFVRGYFDGDGLQSVHSSGQITVGFCGQPAFVTRLQELLCEHAGVKKTKIVYRGENLVTFSNSAKEDVEKYYSFLYPEGEYIFLKRRKDWFTKALNLPS